MNFRTMPGYGDECTWGPICSYDDPRRDDPLYICPECEYGPTADEVCPECGNDEMQKWDARQDAGSDEPSWCIED